MKKIFLTLSILLFPFSAFAGSQTYSTPGTHTFTVPNYTGTLIVEVWGGGGGGANSPNGGGGSSSWNGTVIANGGRDPFVTAPFAGGLGGTASGGDTNLTGGAGDPYGTQGRGGASPNGGIGGKCISGSALTAESNGTSPGGGAGSGILNTCGNGGGGGGYASKTYAAGSLTPGTQVTVVVGAGEQSAVVAGWPFSGNGAPGAVKITWMDAAPPSPPPPSPPVCPAPTSPTTQTTEGTAGSRHFPQWAQVLSRFLNTAALSR